MKVKVQSEKVGLKLNIQKTKIMASGTITSREIDRETVSDFIFWGSKITADGDCSHEIKRRLLLGRKVMTDLDSIFKSRDITLSTKVCLVKAMVFLVLMPWMWELDHKEDWMLKISCFWTVVLEKTLANPLDCKEIQPVHPKGNQSQIFIGRTDAKAETPILWPPDAKNWLIGKDSDAGKDWRQEEKGMTEDEMVVWSEFRHMPPFYFETMSRCEQGCGTGEESHLVSHPCLSEVSGSHSGKHSASSKRLTFFSRPDHSRMQKP